jgi:hypothetical protein
LRAPVQLSPDVVDISLCLLAIESALAARYGQVLTVVTARSGETTPHLEVETPARVRFVVDDGELIGSERPNLWSRRRSVRIRTAEELTAYLARH